MFRNTVNARKNKKELTKLFHKVTGQTIKQLANDVQIALAYCSPLDRVLLVLAKIRSKQLIWGSATHSFFISACLFITWWPQSTSFEITANFVAAFNWVIVLQSADNYLLSSYGTKVALVSHLPQSLGLYGRWSLSADTEFRPNISQEIFTKLQ